MVEPRINAAYLLNNYVWQLLKNNTAMKESDYSGKIPIIPSGQEPEFTAIDKPFLVYGYSEDMTADLYALRSGALSYAVWSTSVGEINTLLATIKASLERHDESAREVNSYTSTVPLYNGIRFDNIHIGYLEGPSPEDSEGGRHAGIITIRYQYTMDIIVKKPVVTNGVVTWV